MIFTLETFHCTNTSSCNRHVEDCFASNGDERSHNIAFRSVWPASSHFVQISFVIDLQSVRQRAISRTDEEADGFILMMLEKM